MGYAINVYVLNSVPQHIYLSSAGSIQSAHFTICWFLTSQPAFEHRITKPSSNELNQTGSEPCVSLIPPGQTWQQYLWQHWEQRNKTLLKHACMSNQGTNIKLYYHNIFFFSFSTKYLKSFKSLTSVADSWQVGVDIKGSSGGFIPLSETSNKNGLGLEKIDLLTYFIHKKQNQKKQNRYSFINNRTVPPDSFFSTSSTV